MIYNDSSQSSREKSIVYEIKKMKIHSMRLTIV